MSVNKKSNWYGVDKCLWKGEQYFLRIRTYIYILKTRRNCKHPSIMQLVRITTGLDCFVEGGGEQNVTSYKFLCVKWKFGTKHFPRKPSHVIRSVQRRWGCMWAQREEITVGESCKESSAAQMWAGRRVSQSASGRGGSQSLYRAFLPYQQDRAISLSWDRCFIIASETVVTLLCVRSVWLPASAYQLPLTCEAWVNAETFFIQPSAQDHFTFPYTKRDKTFAKWTKIGK
jgi:hypothetical protein